MSAFNLLLTSDGCIDNYPNNHGGGFKIDMYDELYLAGNWEVALSQMTYYGQDFVNVPDNARLITMAETRVEEMSRDYTLWREDANNMVISLFKMYGGAKGDAKVWDFYFPQNDYTWESFVKYFNDANNKVYIANSNFDHNHDKGLYISLIDDEWFKFTKTNELRYMYGIYYV